MNLIMKQFIKKFTLMYIYIFFYFVNKTVEQYHTMWTLEYYSILPLLFIIGIPPLLKGEGVGPSKNWVTLRVPKFLLERGDNPEKGGLCRNGGMPLFFITSQFNYILCMYVGKVKFSLIRFNSSVFWVNHKILIQVFILLKHCTLVYFWSILIVYRQWWLPYLN